MGGHPDASKRLEILRSLWVVYIREHSIVSPENLATQEHVMEASREGTNGSAAFTALGFCQVAWQRVGRETLDNSRECWSCAASIGYTSGGLDVCSWTTMV